MHQFWELFQPYNDQSEHIVDKVVDGISDFSRLWTSLEQEICIDVELTSQILSRLEGTQTIEVIVDEGLDSLLLLNKSVLNLML